MPLQYVLGSQPFGSLDIKCRPGVLVPRPETEAYVCHVVDMIKSGKLLGKRPSSADGELNIIDFCTGTGCIPLLLFSSFQQSTKLLNVRGVDISPTALQLALQNLAHNVRLSHILQPRDQHVLSFEKADVFNEADIQRLASTDLDLMISNPPYVSKDVWNHGRGHLGYSVRKYEPRLALVPGDHLPIAPEGLQQEDIFYARLLDVALVLKPRVLLLEIGEEDQARRVLEYCLRHAFSKGAQVQVWRDWPDLESNEEDNFFNIKTIDGQDQMFEFKGSGNIRSIIVEKSI